MNELAGFQSGDAHTNGSSHTSPQPRVRRLELHVCHFRSVTLPIYMPHFYRTFFCLTFCYFHALYSNFSICPVRRYVHQAKSRGSTTDDIALCHQSDAVFLAFIGFYNNFLFKENFLSRKSNKKIIAICELNRKCYKRSQQMTSHMTFLSSTRELCRLFVTL